MQCYFKNSLDDKITEDSPKGELPKKLEDKVNQIINGFKIEVSITTGCEAESDNGYDNKETETTYYEIDPNSFIVMDGKIYGFLFENIEAKFNGTTEYSWGQKFYSYDNSSYTKGWVNGSTSTVDRGYYYIRKK